MSRQSLEKCGGCPFYGVRLAEASGECSDCEGFRAGPKPKVDVPMSVRYVSPKALELPEKHCELCGIVKSEDEFCTICGGALVQMPTPGASNVPF